MNTGNKNPIVVDEEQSVTQNSLSSPLVFDSVEKIFFCLLNDSNSFSTVDYDVNIITIRKYSTFHVFKYMPNQELNTLHHICELERTQLLLLLAISV